MTKRRRGGRRRWGRWRNAPSAWSPDVTNETQFERDREGQGDDSGSPVRRLLTVVVGVHPFPPVRLFYLLHALVVILMLFGTLPWPWALGALVMGVTIQQLVVRAFRAKRPWHRRRHDEPRGNALQRPLPPVRPGDPPLPPAVAPPR